MARPTKYTIELADKICEEIATSSIGLNHICEKLEIAPSSVYLWLKDNKEFSEKYARAREKQADYLVEEILEIADDGTNDLMTVVKGDISYEMENKEVVNRSKLRVDARKWVASKLAPKKYGDKLELSGDSENPVSKISLTDEQVKDIATKLKDAF